MEQLPVSYISKINMHSDTHPGPEILVAGGHKLFMSLLEDITPVVPSITEEKTHCSSARPERTRSRQDTGYLHP